MDVQVKIKKTYNEKLELGEGDYECNGWITVSTIRELDKKNTKYYGGDYSSMSVTREVYRYSDLTAMSQHF